MSAAVFRPSWAAWRRKPSWWHPIEASFAREAVARSGIAQRGGVSIADQKAARASGRAMCWRGLAARLERVLSVAWRWRRRHGGNRRHGRGGGGANSQHGARPSLLFY